MTEVNTSNVCLHVNIYNREHLGLGIVLISGGRQSIRLDSELANFGNSCKDII